ncbi:MarR family transcriptional regulator [Paraburkholderia bengalensis]|uniref:MarR family transcriptional regulator n=1 Tax=Paraburkholderia bengalensis TaxID=2747562 RepID=A0ABU8IMH1_9BURK
MESAATALPANLFPSAMNGAPDLDDSAAPASSKPSSPFPTSAFSRAIVAPEMREEAPAPKGTKIERAIAFIRDNGPATLEQLGKHLDVKRESVSAHLQNAIKDGRLVRADGKFTLGDGKPPVEAKAAPVPKAEKKAAAESAPRAPKVAGNDAKVAASLCIGDLQIIGWATGNLTIRANDNVVDLNAPQLAALRAFLELAR